MIQLSDRQLALIALRIDQRVKELRRSRGYDPENAIEIAITERNNASYVLNAILEEDDGVLVTALLSAVRDLPEENEKATVMLNRGNGPESIEV